MYGRQLLTTNTILPTRVSADGSPHYKAGGATIDWANAVSAPGSDTNLPDGSLIRSGNKFLRYGQVVCRVTGSADTITIGGSPTGGTFTLTVTTDYPVPGASQTTAGIAFNAAASAVQTALAALTNVGANVTVSGSAGGPYTIVFGSILGTVVVTGSAAGLTGGTPTLTAGSSLGTGNTVGYFGPFDSAASDGRQTLTRGSCYILDETVLQNADGLVGFVSNDQIGSLIEGGLVWLDRIIQSGTGTHSLAAGPTFAELVAAFPNLRFVQD